MKNTKVIWGLGALLLFGGLIIYAQPNADQKKDDALKIIKGTGTLTTPESQYDFGTISMKKGNVKHTFTVKNTGSEAVSVEKIYTSCMCTTATLLKDDKKFGPFGMPGHVAVPRINVVLEPGEGVSVDAVFDPNAHGPAGVGKIERVVVLENSAGAPVELGFSAYVTP
ncbi:hypothetical protein A2W54_02090 [Candidatus Giovannonibacteria bacterium RIFCSPHIGHO2_02_43_13]|uniref:DUF1573 domain-containing protein n=1 Tax=Candidatus Giovannonibacteria bacterium RIFCSPHIGHO2_02_43_13 TaxID=1798330 RepID=A0A1F5WUC5_9BACT|nr:MAG: hypothetical protein UW28_C0010G0005 [Parcubacteria group bacterium GW2011_GWA2_44_13]OGF79249.1 MAG: hypothetical protein A2W54_02090 [Candidatus Giovannonibacteria bacterium RIFCSPHIGHO2_02_43_13]OGF88709.1 MAG: hypothetical protein A3I94_01355 [Candidatus Giovannonibacteria bacterium RIFCSPLOWO2_02_FULL_43_54]OGF96967.1 MAG: hypothetical protein A3H08_02000 [Candidatus Giovannonibacteria bacterium RIFCSPLOWO2_12_FULL_44_32]